MLLFVNCELPISETNWGKESGLETNVHTWFVEQNFFPLIFASIADGKGYTHTYLNFGFHFQKNTDRILHFCVEWDVNLLSIFLRIKWVMFEKMLNRL